MIRRLLLAGRPAETRFFLFIGVFGLGLAAVYWFLTYELAGTLLLGGFGLGGLVFGVALLADRGGAGSTQPADGGPTPFVDERGRLPGETLAPMALGLGVALALTAVVFGPWLLVAGVVPLAWGAWQWLSGARDELAATVRDDAADAARDPLGGAAGAGGALAERDDLADAEARADAEAGTGAAPAGAAPAERDDLADAEAGAERAALEEAGARPAALAVPGREELAAPDPDEATGRGA